MTIPTLLTQGATTHIKDGLPVTTVSNLGALTQASEELIMQIKETADKALKIAEGGGGGGGGSSEELEEVKKIANEANDRSLSNKVSIDSLTTSLNATNSTLNSYISATDARLGTIESSIASTNTRLDSVEANLSVAVPYSSVVGKSVSQYKIVEKDGLLFRANSAILEVPAVFDPTAWTQVGGRDMALDEATISKTADDKLQAIGVIEKNKGNTKYDWVGTYQEWVDQNVAEEHPEWICYITDDSTEDASDKLNTDVSNITTEGKETVVSWGMPDYTAVVKTSSLPELYADKNYYVKMQAATASGFDLYKGDTLIMTEIILSANYVSSSCIVPKGYTIKFRSGSAYNLWYCPLIS